MFERDVYLEEVFFLFGRTFAGEPFGYPISSFNYFCWEIGRFVRPIMRVCIQLKWCTI